MAKKTIVLTGGGSGGHITPLLSVAEVLQKEAPEYALVYVGQKNDPMVAHMQNSNLFSKVYVVRAGKFRRYHGQGIKQLVDLPTLAKNIRDAFFVGIGFLQSFRLLLQIKPRVLFCKGGYVGVPLGLAAALLRIPYVTHDSDGVPGLANKIIGKWATVHTVALPKETYTYPTHKTITVGVPVQKTFKKVTPETQEQARAVLGIPKTAPVLLITGGGLGAKKINDEIISSVQELFIDQPKLHILHIAGEKNEQRVTAAYVSVVPAEQLQQVHVYGFTSKLATLSAAATVVVMRAGATNLAEFAVQAKPCIIVPHPHLTGGHQLKNAKVYADAGAALVVQESSLHMLTEAILLLLANKQKQAELSEKIETLANKNAAQMLAGVLVTTAQKVKK